MLASPPPEAVAADHRQVDPGSRGAWLPVLLGSLALAVAATVILVLLRGESYWNYSDGVYAYTARAVLHGGSLYDQIAAAQPPLVYLVGSGLLAISDTVMGLRLGLGLFQVASAVLAAVAIHRLTGSRAAGLAGSLLVLLAPRTLHDFANLLPETIGAPLTLGAAVAASRPKWCWLAGVLGALAILTKLPFVFPIAAIFWFSADRRRFLIAGVSAGLILTLLFLALFGTAFIKGTFFAQSGSGLADGDLLIRELGQALWNLIPLLPLAIVAIRMRAAALDSDLARLIVAGGIGSLAIFITVIKHGAYINLAVAAEPFLVILAVCGTVWAVRRTKNRGRTIALTGALWILFFSQAGSLIVAPNNPEAFAQPLDSPNYGQVASSSEVRDGARILGVDRCNRGQPYYSSPFMAFAANIRLPGNQGDPFIVGVSDLYREQRAQIEREACR